MIIDLHIAISGPDEMYPPVYFILTSENYPHNMVPNLMEKVLDILKSHITTYQDGQLQSHQ